MKKNEDAPDEPEDASPEGEEGPSESEKLQLPEDVGKGGLSAEDRERIGIEVEQAILSSLGKLFGAVALESQGLLPDYIRVVRTRIN